MRIKLTLISFALAIAAIAFLLVAPVYSTGGMVAQIRGSDVQTEAYRSSATLLRVNGSRVLIPVLIPAMIALLPLLFRYRAVCVIATALLFAFVVIGGFSIGLYYLPAALLMLLAACASPTVRVAEPRS